MLAFDGPNDSPSYSIASYQCRFIRIHEEYRWQMQVRVMYNGKDEVFSIAIAEQMLTDSYAIDYAFGHAIDELLRAIRIKYHNLFPLEKIRDTLLMLVVKGGGYSDVINVAVSNYKYDILKLQAEYNQAIAEHLKTEADKMISDTLKKPISDHSSGPAVDSNVGDFLKDIYANQLAQQIKDAEWAAKFLQDAKPKRDIYREKAASEFEGVEALDPKLWGEGQDGFF